MIDSNMKPNYISTGDPQYFTIATIIIAYNVRHYKDHPINTPVFVGDPNQKVAIIKLPDQPSEDEVLVMELELELFEMCPGYAWRIEFEPEQGAFFASQVIK